MYYFTFNILLIDYKIIALMDPNIESFQSKLWYVLLNKRLGCQHIKKEIIKQ